MNSLYEEEYKFRKRIDSCREQIEHIHGDKVLVESIINDRLKREKLEKFKKGTYWTNSLAPTVGETQLFKVLSSRKYREDDRICKLLIIDFSEQTIEIREICSSPNFFTLNFYGLMGLTEAPKEFVEGTLEKAKKLFKL